MSTTLHNSRKKSLVAAIAVMAIVVIAVIGIFAYFSGKHTDGLAAISDSPDPCDNPADEAPAAAPEQIPTAPPAELRHDLLSTPDADLTTDPKIRKFLDALRLVETGTREDSAVGDSGRSVGAYQIQRSYIKDVGMPVSYWRTIAATRELAEVAIVRYLKRYAPAELVAQDWASLAKCHHIGPDFRTRCPQTGQAYAQRVLATMARQ